ncbi:MAG: cupin domain-containing protein [Bacteroidales bacterium]|nr:cupin domain-containing protein [Bacteroidales bacterium]
MEIENRIDFVTPPEHIRFMAKRLFNSAGRIIDGSIAYIEPGGGGPVALHTHIHNHLFIVISGRAKIIMGDTVKILNPDEAFLVKGGVPHSVWNDADCTTIMVGISVTDEE